VSGCRHRRRNGDAGAVQHVAGDLHAAGILDEQPGLALSANQPLFEQPGFGIAGRRGRRQLQIADADLIDGGRAVVGQVGDAQHGAGRRRHRGA
jgi:hypothetical protein